jgi:hypothetical protein
MGGHATEDAEGNVKLVRDEEKKARAVSMSEELNFVGGDIQKQLRSKKVYFFPSNPVSLKVLIHHSTLHLLQMRISKRYRSKTKRTTLMASMSNLTRLP